MLVESKCDLAFCCLKDNMAQWEKQCRRMEGWVGEVEDLKLKMKTTTKYLGSNVGLHFRFT